MAAPLVSILIPCYNAASWLAETLESALAQTWPHKEIIVVDDGSTDDSAGIARAFVQHGMRLIPQPNRGASAARNAALAAPRGDYFQFLDADDLLAPDKLARQMQLAATIATDRAICGTWSRFIRTPAEADFTPQLLCADAAPIDWLVIKYAHHAMMHPAA
jgi:glycosyltransferase involved in cell wall biosynthesis